MRSRLQQGADYLESARATQAPRLIMPSPEAMRWGRRNFVLDLSLRSIRMAKETTTRSAVVLRATESVPT